MTTDHPIQGLMKTAMENIRTMIDINTIIGNPIHTPSGQVIIPVSKVGFGFAAGGSEFTGRLTTNTKHKHTKHDEQEHNHTDCCGTASIQKATPKHPFGGGSGGGVSVSPIGFIVVDGNNIKFLPIDGQHQIYERLFEVVPEFLQKFISKKKKNRDEDCPTSRSYVRPPEYGSSL